ncbi:MAG TPA: phosphoribosyltransferase [Alphaproteobacteria bacterium]|nr:phosphoribosyltransferase [Alphaproteobacteria bacterium]
MFRDRYHAGHRLAGALRHLRGTDSVVLALPRGGVPVGFEVAKALSVPLDLLLVRKIGVPAHEELALGAVVDGTNPQLVLNEEVMAAARPPAGYIETALRKALAEIERRRRLYLADAEPVEIAGRAAVVIDDGIATGATMKAALRGVRRNQPYRLVLAVPVAPGASVDELRSECDEAVVLETPEPFYAVGSHYADFNQTTDEEVVALLAKARAWRRST